MGGEKVFKESVRQRSFSESNTRKSEKVQEVKMSGTRREVLRLFKTIMRLGQRWEASNPIETRVEREYIVEEARLAEEVTFFLQNSSLLKKNQK